MQVRPSRPEFLDLAASHAVVPVHVEVLADRLTPVSVYEALVGGGDGFLLESVEGGERWARWSFVGWAPAFTLTAFGGVTSADGIASVPAEDDDPLTVLERLVAEHSTPDAAAVGMDPPPPLHAGAVGYLAYDVVRYIEHLPDQPADDRSLPEMMWQFFGRLAVVDRLGHTVRLVRNIFVADDPAAQYDAAVDDLAAMMRQLGSPPHHGVGPRPTIVGAPPAEANLTQGEYEAAVERAVKYIHAGDVFQVVPSLRFETQFSGDSFAVYRALRLINPSPYMYYLRSGDVAIAGSSPELMSRVRNGKVASRPIAGTRRRGATGAEDDQLEAEVLADPKERAEHVMLVDLARNDLGRVCEFGSVTVDELMVIERYSHVMHIVSEVSGSLRTGLGPVDVLRATFPHGTVSGAPKVRAMEIIDELEPTARGPYAGAVGYIDFSGNMDTAIGLRTMVARGPTAWIQAGAGVVADSDPTFEYNESVAKAGAVLAAIEAARNLDGGVS